MTSRPSTVLLIRQPGRAHATALPEAGGAGAVGVRVDHGSDDKSTGGGRTGTAVNLPVDREIDLHRHLYFELTDRNLRRCRRGAGDVVVRGPRAVRAQIADAQ